MMIRDGLCAAVVLTTVVLGGCSATAVASDEPSAVGSGLYNRTIAVAYEQQLPTGRELADWLTQIVGEPFEVQQTPADSAIILARADAGDGWSPPGGTSVLDGRGPEAFLIRSNGADRLWIVGNSNAAVRHGVYFYLEALGCRWFMPGENWTIVPRLSGIGVHVDRVEAPAFDMRSFFGTGGFGGSLPLDRNRQLQERWNAWIRRVRLGGSIAISGHAGETFNLTHRKELEASLDMLAEINGKRQPWGLTTKPCYSNPKMVELYVRDRLTNYERVSARNPDSPGAFAISVEPSDGGGHCTCASCMQLGSGSVSDRVYTLVNAVARAMSKQHPGRNVSLYAYYEHALPPTIPIEPNVYVSVVPYGLQYTGIPGDELLQMWAQRVEQFGVYDYWSIDDWSNNLPAMSFNLAATRIQRWHQLGARGAQLQSAHSSGSVGPVIYLASRLLWNPQADADAILDDFYTRSFGEAAAPMRRMIDRWFSGFLLTEHELGLSYRDLQEAMSLATDPAVRARIDDYRKYLHYIRLWHEYQQAQGEDRRRAADDLIRYCWRVYDSCMVASYRMTMLIAWRYEKQDPSLRGAWDFKTGKAYADITPLSDGELDALFADGASTYQPADFEQQHYSRKLAPVSPAETLSDKWASSPHVGVTTTFEFQPPWGVSEVRFRFRCGPSYNRPTDTVTVSAPDGTTLVREQVPTDGQVHELVVPTAQQGNYRIHVFDQKARFVLQFPSNLPLAAVSGVTSTDLSGELYFYVPAGLKRIAMYYTGVLPPIITDGDGQRVEHTGRRLILVDVPPGKDGSVWSIRQFKSWEPLRLLNVPNFISFSRDGMMAPEELLDR